MKRRHFLAALPALLLIGQTRAQHRCELNRDGQHSCVAGLDQALADTAGREQPSGSNWCWAACLEMIFAFHGYDVPMDDIVQQTYGSKANLAAESGVLTRLLSQRWRDRRGREFDSRCEVLWQAGAGGVDFPAAVAARYLAENKPLIIGTHQHAMVLSALAFTHSGDPASMQITQAVVRDPAPGMGRRVLMPEELAQTTLLLAAELSQADRL